MYSHIQNFTTYNAFGDFLARSKCDLWPISIRSNKLWNKIIRNLINLYISMLLCTFDVLLVLFGNNFVTKIFQLHNTIIMILGIVCGELSFGWYVGNCRLQAWNGSDLIYAIFFENANHFYICFYFDLSKPYPLHISNQIFSSDLHDIWYKYKPACRTSLRHQHVSKNMKVKSQGHGSKV